MILRPGHSGQIFSFQRLHHIPGYEGADFCLGMCIKILINHHDYINAGKNVGSAMINIIASRTIMIM
jgi:hypothetical protein